MGSLSRAVFGPDHIGQHNRHAPGRIGRNHPAHGLRSEHLDGLVIFIGEPFHDIGLHQNASVGNRRQRCDELNGGDRNALPEADVGRIHPRPAPDGPQDTRRLTRQVNARPGAKTEIFNIRIKLFPAELFRDFGRADVAGVLNDVPHGQITMLFMVGFPNHSVGNLIMSILAVKAVRLLDDFFFKGGGDQKGLKG